MLTGADPDRPLDGAVVVEAGALLPVPSAGAALARLGAEVVRVEPPSGDPAQRLYGGWLHELYGVGKRAVRLDPRDSAGRAELRSLLARADVVLVGFRPAAARRLGLDAASVRAAWPEIVHCSIVGFPSDGPDADRPGHDLSFLARSGALCEPAGPSAVGQPPRRPAIPVADLAGGAVATQAVLAALLAREAGHAGRAIEIALDDVALAWTAPRLGGAVGPRFGAALDPANDLFACADGRHLAMGAIEPRFWEAAHDALADAAPLPPGARAWGSAERIRHADALAPALRAAFAARPSADWLAVLDRAGVPVDPVLDGAEAAARVGGDPAAWRALATPLPFGDRAPRAGAGSAA